MRKVLNPLLTAYPVEAKNAGWLLAEKAFNLVVNFAFFLVLARYLGPNLLGQYSIVLSLFFMLVPVSNLGLNGIAAKEFINLPHYRQTIFGTTIALRFLGSLAVILIICIVAFQGWFSIDDQQVAILVLLAVANMSRSLGVVEIFFKSQSQNREIVIVRMAVLLVSTLTKLYGIYLGWSLNVFLVFVGLEWIVTNLGYYILLRYQDKTLVAWRFSTQYGKSLLSRSLWLVLSGLASYVYLKTDILMIGHFVGSEEAGYYSAATRLSEIWYFLPTLTLVVFYPRLQALEQDGQGAEVLLIRGILTVLVSASVLIASMTALGSDMLVGLLYGDTYSVSASLVAIQAWVLVFVFVRVVYSSWLLLNGLYKYSLISHLSGAVANVLLNLLLIPAYAGKGAAFATLGAYLASTLLIPLLFAKTRGFVALTGRSILDLALWPVKRQVRLGS